MKLLKKHLWIWQSSGTFYGYSFNNNNSAQSEIYLQRVGGGLSSYTTRIALLAFI